VGILPHQRQAAVRRVFIGLFRRYGLPKVIRMDNGSPFGSTGAWGLSALSVWWLTLGHPRRVHPTWPPGGKWCA